MSLTGYSLIYNFLACAGADCYPTMGKQLTVMTCLQAGMENTSRNRRYDSPLLLLMITAEYMSDPALRPTANYATGFRGNLPVRRHRQESASISVAILGPSFWEAYYK